MSSQLDCMPSTVIDCKKIKLKEIDFSNCEDLTIWHFNPDSHSFEELPELKQIKRLCVNFTNAESLNGLEKLPDLKRLELAYCPKLTSLDGLPDSLDFLMIEHAGKLCGYEKISALKGLKVLRLHECGDIESLNFLNSLPQLTEFRFVNTSIADGNLQPLISHIPKLTAVAFSNKRHYSHTLKQVLEELGITL